MSLHINGRQVFLRRFNLSDVEKIFRMSLEDGMKQWIPDQVYRDLDEAKEVISFLMDQYDSTDGPSVVPVVFGICLRETGELIGHAGLSPVSGQVEVGYAIENCQKKKGFATDAVAALCAWGKEHYSLPYILGIVASDNAASCRVLEKAGFILSEEVERELHGTRRMVRIYRF